MATSHYELRVRGRLSDPVPGHFDTLEPDAAGIDAILRGPIRDQAELHGVPERVQSVGLELLEGRRLPD